MKKLIIYIFLLLTFSSRLFSQTVTVGNGGSEYLNLQEAFADINAGNITGDIVLQIIDNCTQPGTAVLFPTGYLGNSDYTSITIYPVGSGYTVSGNVNGPLIDLNGATNVTFDGRVNQSGPADLIITNQNTGVSASTIQFSESANNNILHYCIIKGAGTGASSGVIFFSTSSSGSGNDANTFDNNSITADAAGRPVNAIFSSGTSGSENSGNTISNNNIYDFFNPGISSNGIFLSSSTTAWTINGNSFYETAPFVPAAAVTYNVLQINNTSGTGFNVTGNYIGGSSALNGGSAWTKTNGSDNPFYGINMNVGTGTASNLQNNTISNFNWSNSSNATWTGIDVAGGDVNIGMANANTIGATTGTGSVTVTGGITNSNVYGITIESGGTVNCQNNNIGSINAANDPANATNFYGINTSGSGNITISNNTVGSTSTSNSINASSVVTANNAQAVMAISNNSTGAITINGNTIANITNSTTNTGVTRRGLIDGISSTSGTVTISNNVIRDLTIANGNTSAIYQASVCGIALTGVTLPKIIAGNTIYNLSNSYSSFAGSIIGIFITGTTSPVNQIRENFIHNISVSGSSASIYGIKSNTGTTTYSNNIISLSGNNAITIYGIYETGVSGNTNNLYFNTVYIAGAPTSGARNSYALFSAVNSTSRNFRNNIFFNARSNSGATGTHYAMFIATTGGTLVCDYNDYYVSGTGGVLGFYGSSKAALPIVTAQDVNSRAVDPLFTVAGSSSASDYIIGADLVGVSGTGITTDFGSFARVIPTMGAWEKILNKWTGTSSTAWNLASNWSANAIPLENSNLVFDTSPVNDLHLDADHSVINITNGSAKLLVTNGHQLTIKGNLIFTNGAQIDATASSSALVYSGVLAQTIDGTNFVTGKTYNLIIDNTVGVTLNTNFTVDNALTINSGKQLTVSAGNLLTVTGTFTNNAGNPGFIIKSVANGNDGKLINNSASVPGTVEMYLSGGAGTLGPAFHYFVPPVQTMNFNNSSIATAAADLGLTFFSGDLVSYSETAAGSNKDNGWQYFDGYNSTTPFSSLSSANGYNIFLSANDKITFKGNLNGSAHNFNNLSFTNLGWNLVGNPYPCNYDLSGISALTASDNVDNTIYFNHDGGYAYWNVETGAGTTGYSNVMPPMQGFFVHVIASGQSLNLPVAYKTGSAALPVRSKGLNVSKSKGILSVKKIKLLLNNGVSSDETIVCLIDNATAGFDGDYDAYKFFGGNALSPFIYTNLNSLKYAINSIPVPPDSNYITIPVTVELKTSGTYTISATEFENLNGLSVILEHGANKTTLTQNASYSFTKVAGTYTDFKLLIGQIKTTIPVVTQDSTVVENQLPAVANQIPTGIEDPIGQELKTWYSNNYLYLQCTYEVPLGKALLTIYDLQGKVVYSNNQENIVPGQIIQVPVNLPIGIYITRVMIGPKRLVSKIVVF